MSFYVSTETFLLLHCDEWDRVVALPRHKFVTGATLLQLTTTIITEILWKLTLVNIERGYFIEFMNSYHIAENYLFVVKQYSLY